MVERHSVEFTDKDEAQKLEFFEGDVHLGHYDFRFDFNDKKFFSISADGTVNLRIHSEPKIAKVWLLVEDNSLSCGFYDGLQCARMWLLTPVMPIYRFGNLVTEYFDLTLLKARLFPKL